MDPKHNHDTHDQTFRYEKRTKIDDLLDELSVSESQSLVLSLQCRRNAVVCISDDPLLPDIQDRLLKAQFRSRRSAKADIFDTLKQTEIIFLESSLLGIKRHFDDINTRDYQLMKPLYKYKIVTTPSVYISHKIPNTLERMYILRKINRVQYKYPI